MEVTFIFLVTIFVVSLHRFFQWLPEEEEDLGRHRTVRGRKVVPLGRDLPGFDQGVKGQ
jgi:hypothetical protein